MDNNGVKGDDNDLSQFSDHKLCGFLCTVLTVSSSSSSPPRVGSLLRISRENGSVYFVSGDGEFYLIAVAQAAAEEEGEQYAVNRNPRQSSGKKRKRKKNGKGKGSSAAMASGKIMRRSGVGMVKGSVSVLEQLHALVAHRCVRISARLVWAEEARAVVIVDVYLPEEVWMGTEWQFPKSGSVAAALFRHLSCDWGLRNSIIANEDFVRYTLRANTDVWDLADCHVLGCKLHYNNTDSSKKKLYELHEIFKGVPSVANVGYTDSSRIQPVDDSCHSGLWELSDDILMKVLVHLGITELLRIGATCRHLRFLAASIMPCMKLNLFPHQQAAVQWMLQREQFSEVLPHPLYTGFSTEDGFSFYMSTISGEIVSGAAPTINDFHGGMFCDEPGLGKTITALSLVLKTQGKFVDPPDGVHVNWCTHNGDKRCGYYDLGSAHLAGNYLSPGKRDVGQRAGSGQPGYHSLKRAKFIFLNDQNSNKTIDLSGSTCSEPPMHVLRCTRDLNSIKKNLAFTLEESASEKATTVQKFGSGKRARGAPLHALGEALSKCKRSGNSKIDQIECNDTWVQCDSCHKWRKLQESCVSDAGTVWFCSMNSDPLYQNCSVLEETYDNREPITHLLGFYSKGTSGAEEQNVTFFASVLKEHQKLINSATKKALSWLVKLSPNKMLEMETIGIQGPFVSTLLVPNEDAQRFQKIFKAFGLRKGVDKGTIKWHYPQNLDNLAFDTAALRIALCTPLDSNRLYLSKATLVVVPANLVDHWRTQIQRHVRPGQLQVFLWVDHKRPPSVHSLAWDYDVVITTFSRLSAEWGRREISAMMQVHWLRIILDEGHTLGASVGLTNKLQMVVSLTASNRWILTGTPTPNTPKSQLSHLQPLLKFLHEEAYGQNKKSWEAGILRPFDAEMEEGRSRLMQLLHRCMISARKDDLKNIPPCIKKVTILDFMAEHARSYNELAVTVRRNILMADWNDPSHIESLLNRKQWKFRSATIKNIRLSCCVSGHIKVTGAGEDIQETMDELVKVGLDPLSQEYALIKYNLFYGGDCVRCAEWCRLPVITPCFHLLCLDCVALDSERCTFPGCGNLYEMQTPDSLARPENPNPKWPVPKNLIELQPSYKQDSWDPDWQSTSSSKVAYLISKLKELQASNTLSCQPKDDVTDVNDIQGFSRPSWMRNSNKVVDKVLVFSQFLEHIHVIEQQLSMTDIKFAGMYSPMHSSNKMKSLTMFQNDATCMVLVMDGSAALGLDLSFVSHVFLMEPIWDKSMEEQVISRAHRMGATRPIHVETLAMRSTIEEQMLAFLQDANECKRILTKEIEKTESEGTRTHRSLHDFAENNYLSQLSFVRTNPNV